ncbi:hypothetical protein Tco_0913512 [Tanacetum coccineum]
MEKRAKFLHDTIAAQRRFLAGNKSVPAIRKGPIKELSQALYEKVKRFDKSFTIIGSTEDERKIKEMNEGASDLGKEEEVCQGRCHSREIMEEKYVIARLKSSTQKSHWKKLLSGDLKIMMESSTEENDQSDFWNNQPNWEIVRWRLYEAYGVYILELKDGTFIYMLVERSLMKSKDEMELRRV